MDTDIYIPNGTMSKIIPAIDLMIERENDRYYVREVGSARTGRNDTWEETHKKTFKTLPGVLRYIVWYIQEPNQKHADIRVESNY